MVRLLGITGPIGCGKSTVAEMTRSLKALDVIDADAVVRSLMCAGSELTSSVREAFGDTVVSADGSVDRQSLGRIVFADKGKLRELEQLVHPRVIEQIRGDIDARRGRGESGVVVIEAIRLLDSELQDWVERAWIVSCSHRIQMCRLLTTRGYDTTKAAAMISASPSFESRIPATIIENDGSMEALLVAVTAAWNEFV